MKARELYPLLLLHGSKVKVKVTAEIINGKTNYSNSCLMAWESACLMRGEHPYPKNLGADQKHFEFFRIKMSQEPMVLLNNSGKGISLRPWFVFNKPTEYFI